MMIRHTLGGKPKKHWIEVMQEVGNFFESILKGAVSKLFKKCFSDDDYNVTEIDSLKENHKPKDWKFGRWLQRIKYLEYMDND